MFTATNYVVALALVAVVIYAVVNFVVTGTTDIGHDVAHSINTSFAAAADPRK